VIFFELLPVVVVVVIISNTDNHNNRLIHKEEAIHPQVNILGVFFRHRIHQTDQICDIISIFLPIKNVRDKYVTLSSSL